MPLPVGAVVPAFIRLAHHPVRWSLLTELAASDRRVRELVERTGHPQSLVSYHLRLLRDGGLVTARRSSHDGRDTYYHLALDRCAEGLGSAGASLHPALAATPPPPSGHGVAAPRVLFLCTGNSARSPIAEALLRHHTAGRVAVTSAGTQPGTRIHPHAVRVLRDRFDLDIRGQVPRPVDDVAWLRRPTPTDLVVSLCDRAGEHPSIGRGPRTHWSIADPSDSPGPPGYARFVAVATDIDARVRHLAHALGTTTGGGAP